MIINALLNIMIKITGTFMGAVMFIIALLGVIALLYGMFDIYEMYIKLKSNC